MVAPMLSMTGGRRHKEVDGCDEDVGFDTFCEATQNMLCHMQVVEGEKPSDPDTLDYVFEHVESVVCKEGADDDPNPINIDNSFIEDNLQPEPEIPRIIETFDASSFDTSTEGLSTEPSEAPEAPEMPAPVVQKGAAYEKDMLDYVFEKVESLVCQEDAPDDHYNGEYGTTAEMARDNSLIAVPGAVKKEQTRRLDELERERISNDGTVVVEVIYEDKPSTTKKKKSNKKPWYKKLAFGAGKS